MRRMFMLAILSIVFDGGGQAVDPLEGILKDFAYAARSAINQVSLKFSNGNLFANL